MFPYSLYLKKRKEVFDLPKINGTFLQVHPRIGKFPPPYYNTLEFDRRIFLADCAKEGAPYATDSYEFLSKAEVCRRIGTIDPLKELFFVESNCAHHLSCFLSQSAFVRSKKEGEEKTPKHLVVNFDQHSDHGLPFGRFYCGSWGGYVGCDYFVAGVSKGTEAVLYHCGSGTAEKYRLNDLSAIRAIYDGYEQIYVTVDTDVLVGGENKRTNWPHGDMTKDILFLLLNAVPGKKIAAADITGFPPNIKDEDERNKSIGKLDSYINDIAETAKVLCDLMDRPLYLSN